MLARCPQVLVVPLLPMIAASHHAPIQGLRSPSFRSGSTTLDRLKALIISTNKGEHRGSGACTRRSLWQCGNLLRTKLRYFHSRCRISRDRAASRANGLWGLTTACHHAFCRNGGRRFRRAKHHPRNVSRRTPRNHASRGRHVFLPPPRRPTSCLDWISASRWSASSRKQVDLFPHVLVFGAAFRRQLPSRDLAIRSCYSRSIPSSAGSRGRGCFYCCR